MIRTSVRAVTLLLLAPVSAVVFAQDYDHYLGRRVMTIKPDTEARSGTAAIRKIDLAQVFEVTEVNGKWIWFNYEVGGWVKAEDVVLYEEAIDHFKRLVEQNPSAKNYQQLARAWGAQGELDRALVEINEAIQRNSSDPTSFYVRGTLWSDQGNYDKAIADFDEAIRIDPKVPAPYIDRGLALIFKSDYAKAIGDFDEAIRIDPKNPNAYYNRGLAWDYQGNDAKAIADYGEAIRLDTGKTSAYINRAIIRGFRGDYDQAIADYEKAIRLSPKFPNAYNGLAWLLATCPEAKFHDGERAVKFATKACELTNWKDAGAVNTLSAAYANAGDFDKAKEYLRKAVSLDPDSQKEVSGPMFAAYEAGKPYLEP